MAVRRMFSNRVIDKAAFLRLPPSARLLYYDLGLKADDDGFSESFAVLRTTGATDDDLHELAAKGFIKIVNDDLCWIVDWRENNTIRADRYRPSLYHNLLVQLEGDNQMTTTCQPSGTQMDAQRLTQVRSGKASQGEGSQVQSITGEDALKAYLERIQILHGMSDQVLAYRDRLDDDVIRFGVESALECGGRSVKYIKTVLDSYVRQGLLTVEAVQQHEAERKGCASEKKPLHTLKDHRNSMDYDSWMKWIQAHSSEFDSGDYPGDFTRAVEASLSPDESERRRQEIEAWEHAHTLH